MTETHMVTQSPLSLGCADKWDQWWRSDCTIWWLTSRWYKKTEWSLESAEPYVSNKMTASAFTRARMWRILTWRRIWMLYKVGIEISDTYEDRFLSHKDSGNKIRNSGINFPQVAGLPSFWSIELLVSEGFTLTFNLCSAQRSDFLNCPDIVLTFPISNSYQGPAAFTKFRTFSIQDSTWSYS